jgi:histidinol phosphatase-like enzyme (inositol monophosphatase family)
MSDRPSTLMQAAADVARLAGQHAIRHFRTNIPVERKPDGSPVTAADREAEQAAREWIERYFPDDGVLGEELGSLRPEARRRWLIDPIDGTRSFVRGVPLWGSMVAVARGEAVLAGAVYFPALGEVVVAAPGCGCWWNGIECAVSRVTDLAQAAVLMTDERFGGDRARREAWERLAARAGLSRSWGDCYGYLLVATGRAEVMVDPALSPWDSAALMPIIEEAGGVFTDWRGARTAFGGSVVATNSGVAREARALLG